MRAGLQSLQHICFVGMHAKEYQFRLRQLTRNLPRRFDAVQHRHADIQHRYVGFVRFRQGHRFPAVGCFRDDLETGMALEQETQPLANYVVIVG